MIDNALSGHLGAYYRSQLAISELKTAIFELLASTSLAGLTNAEIGRALGIYHGHIGHEGHVSRTLLGLMEQEGVVQQDDESKRWNLIVRA